MRHSNGVRFAPSPVALVSTLLNLTLVFGLGASFVSERWSHGGVDLPAAVTAKSLGPCPSSRLYLSVTASGRVVVPLADGSDEVLESPDQVEGYLKQQAAAEMLDSKADRPEAMIFLRIDSRTPFEKSYRIMKACSAAGYTGAQLRAVRDSRRDD